MNEKKIFLQSSSSRQAALPIISDSTMKIDLGLDLHSHLLCNFLILFWMDLHSHLLCNSILYIFVANCYAIGRRLQKAILDICCQDNSYSFSTSNFRAFCHNHIFFARRSHETGNVHILHLASSCHLLPKEFDPITLPEVIQLEEVPVNSGHLGNLSICVLISLVTTLRWICFCFFWGIELALIITFIFFSSHAII